MPNFRNVTSGQVITIPDNDPRLDTFQRRARWKMTDDMPTAAPKAPAKPAAKRTTQKRTTAAKTADTGTKPDEDTTDKE